MDIVGIAEIAQRLGVTSAAVTNWRARYSDFPKPIAVLKSGPVFDAEQIEHWNRRKSKMTAKIIASINLKGGVAKTTTTVGLAETLSAEFGKRVLVIDLDPQTNATVMLIGEEQWFELDNHNNTLAALFDDAVNDKDSFNLSSVLQTTVGAVDQVKTVDLLPSSLRLVDLQDHLITMPLGPYKTKSPVDILRRGIKEILDDYDYVLIDCPPNLGYITLNGLRISDGYIIPTIPDILSTYGIPQIVTRISKFSNEIERHIVPIGIVATKVRGRAKIHDRTLSHMRNRAGKPMDSTKLLYPNVFDTIFSESAQMAEAAEHERFSTIRQKWGYSGQYDTFKSFAGEFIKACEEM